MFNWKSIDYVYLYDGTFEGLLTIVFDCYIAKTIPLKIYPINTYNHNFIDNILEIKTNFEKSQRVFNGIERNISYKTLYNAYNAFLCSNNQKEIDILKYLLLGFKIGSHVNNMLSIDYVFKVQAMQKKAFGECHRLKGLLRFKRLYNDIYYSSIHPDNNILEPLGQHFIQRLPTQKFIIHDKNRELYFLYNTKDYKILDSIELSLPEYSKSENYYQELWKAFFKTISIKERTNLKLQMQYMPKKYWEDLVENPEEKNNNSYL